MQSRDEIIHGLMQADTPSIRLLTLLNCRGLPVDHENVQLEQHLLATSEPVLSILKEQHPMGYWISERSFYSPKYRATHWSMQLLMELGLKGDHPAMQSGAAFMRSAVQRGPAWLTDNRSGLSCFWGNYVRYQLYCGQMEQSTTRQVIAFLVNEVEHDSFCPYNYDLPCAWGLIRSLWGLAAIPPDQRNAEVEHAIQHGLEFILDRFSLTKADYPYGQKIQSTWFSLNFPIFYNTDILFTLRVLKELDALSHPSAQAALAWLENKRRKDGTWQGASPARRRTWAFTCGQDTVDTWVTLHALSLFF